MLDHHWNQPIDRTCQFTETRKSSRLVRRQATTAVMAELDRSRGRQWHLRDFPLDREPRKSNYRKDDARTDRVASHFSRLLFGKSHINEHSKVIVHIAGCRGILHGESILEKSEGTVLM